MNAEMINPFINATVNVLSTMAMIQPRAGRPYIKGADEGERDIVGLIGLAGEGKRGAFAVSFSEGCICHVVSNMFGEEFTEMNDEIKDAVGEITNMVSGGARAELAQKGYNFEMAIPTIITGKNTQVDPISASPVIVIPFQTDAGRFYVEVCITDAGGAR